ncbi:MAG: ExbD/TolR family protein, partial [Bacteroidota bacterium]
MKIKRRKKGGAHVNTHALNDIMFFLLLFFLILSTLANPNVIKVLLPQAAETQQKESKKSLQLAVDANRNYFLDGEPVTTDQLNGRLELIAKEFPESSCSISMDRSLSVQ